MKHKTGDMVRIRSKEWIDAQEKNWAGGIRIGESYIFYRSMFEYAGKIARITKVCHNGYYLLDRDDSSWKWTDGMFDPDYTPADPLYAVHAIFAMIDHQETLYSENGDVKYFWDGVFIKASDKNGETIVSKFDDKTFYLHFLKRKRSMTRWEILDWANSGESRGWAVHAEGDERWYSPQFLSYDLDVDRYERARLLPDKSGIDESTIQGFEVEE